VNLELTEEQQLLQKSVREFAEAEVRPLAKELDETGHFPRELFRKAAELGLTGVAFPEAEGGAGFDHIAYSIVIEEISRCCASTGVILSVQNSLFCDPVHRFGTEGQKKKFLLPFARGEKIGCYALTEPQAGSNAAALETKAVKRGGKYILNGTKAWITNGGVADAAIVYVNTDPAKGEKGITAVVVEKGTPGFKVGKEEKKLGINATACSELVFTDCEVPEENRIGNEGEGYKVALSTLDGGRIGIASQATGIAQGAFEAALKWSEERISRPFNSCSRTWPPKSTPRGCWFARRRGSRTPAAGSASKPPRQNYFRAKWPPASRTKPSRSTAATATAANILSSAPIATPASPKSTKAPAKFSAW
jgi:acyl-CoA dehydrogenase